jgi:hypothetical protein
MLKEGQVIKVQVSRKTQLIKKFHVLLSKNGLGNDAKEGMLAGYGVASTKDLNAFQLLEACRALEHNADNTQPFSSEMDKWRKRAIGAAFGVAKHLGYVITTDGAIGMVLRAAGKEYTRFNSIPQARLQAIYNGFRNNLRDFKGADKVVEELLLAKNKS